MQNTRIFALFVYDVSLCSIFNPFLEACSNSYLACSSSSDPAYALFMSTCQLSDYYQVRYNHKTISTSDYVRNLGYIYWPLLEIMLDALHCCQKLMYVLKLYLLVEYLHSKTPAGHADFEGLDSNRSQALYDRGDKCHSTAASPRGTLTDCAVWLAVACR